MFHLNHGYFFLTYVTFDIVEAAQRALATLNGQDIYAGCCTLKIDYSKVIDMTARIIGFCNTGLVISFGSIRKI